MSGLKSFFAFDSASAERNENHKNQPRACFRAAGRNAQRRWGDFWGLCDLQIEIGRIGFGLGFDTPAHVYDMGGGFN